MVFLFIEPIPSNYTWWVDRLQWKTTGVLTLSAMSNNIY